MARESRTWQRFITQNGETTVAYDDIAPDGLCTEQEAHDWIQTKRFSHAEKGWTVDYHDPVMLHLRKTYAEGPVPEKARKLYIRQAN